MNKTEDITAAVAAETLAHNTLSWWRSVLQYYSALQYCTIGIICAISNHCSRRVYPCHLIRQRKCCWSAIIICTQRGLPICSSTNIYVTRTFCLHLLWRWHYIINLLLLLRFYFYNLISLLTIHLYTSYISRIIDNSFTIIITIDNVTIIIDNFIIIIISDIFSIKNTFRSFLFTQLVPVDAVS